MSLPRKIWEISSFDKGVGNYNIPGMFYWSQGLDFDFSAPYLRVAPKLFKETDNIVLTNLNEVSWETSFDGTQWFCNLYNRYFFKYNSGWQEVRQNGQAGGGLGLLGDDDYLYYASNAYAGRFDKTNWYDTWQSFNVSNGGSLCPIQKFLKFICYGNQRYLAVWDKGSSTWNNNRVILPIGYEIKWLRPLNDYLAICAFNSEGSTIFLWDGISQTYNYAVKLENIRALSAAVVNNVPYVITNDGWINELSGDKLIPIVKFPDIEFGETILIQPDAVKSNNGLVYIGKRSEYGKERYKMGGIWVFNPITKALYFKHMLSSLAVKNIAKIGSISFINNTVRVFWNTNDNYYVDLASDSGSLRPYNCGAFFITSLYDDEPYRKKRFNQIIFNFFRAIPNSANAKIIAKYNVCETIERTQVYANGGSSNYFTVANVPSDWEIGDEITVLAGSGAGQIRHIAAVDYTLKRITLDESLSTGSFDSTSLIQISPFKKIAEIRGNIYPGLVNKLLRFNARAKKIFLKFEIWSPSGFVGEWDMGIANLSLIYTPDRTIK